MKKYLCLIILLFVLWSVAGCVKPCSTSVAGPGPVSTAELVKGVSDPLGDLILDHALFTEQFDVTFRSNDDIPRALDIVRVDLTDDRSNFYFHVTTDGESLKRFWDSETRQAQVGLYLDTDNNGVSDLILSTTLNPEKGVVLTPDLAPDKAVDMPVLKIMDNKIVLSVPRKLTGEHFTWTAFTGFTPRNNAYYETAMPAVFFLPMVDIARASDESMIDTWSSYSIGSCQILGSYQAECGKYTVPDATVPGTTLKGKRMLRKVCNGRGMEVWCIARSYFAKRVFTTSHLGFVARCPFDLGNNTEGDVDTNGDQIMDRIEHQVIDEPPPDKDGDGKKDIMQYFYTYPGNTLKICNKERDKNTGALLGNRCKGNLKPYAQPYSIPDHVN